MAAPIERELKYSLVDPPPAVADVVAAAGAGPYAFADAGMTVHLDRYFDDEAGRLARAGLALRRRAAEGRVVAALKTLGSVTGAFHEREELEAPMTGDDWPMPLARRLTHHVALWQLRPRIELTVERSLFHVVFEGRPVAHLSFDEVRARYPENEREALFGEVEVEARGDVPLEVLTDAVALIDGLVRLTPSGVTKLQRAEALLALGAAF